MAGFFLYEILCYLCTKFKILEMKKIIIILSFAAACLCSCSETDYQKEAENRIQAFNEECMSIFGNEELSDEAKEDLVEDRYDAVAEELWELAEAALKKHNDDSVAVYMVGLVAQLDVTDAEGILGYIEKLGPNAQADPMIQKMKKSYEKKNATAAGSKFVDFEVMQPNGKTAKLSDYAGKGQYCLVDFWASWCGPCKREIPNLKKVYEKYGKKGLRMVSVAVWDNPQASIDTAKAYGITWDHIVDAQHVPTELYGIEGIPHILLIGPDGTILKRDLRGEGIKEELEKYF